MIEFMNESSGNAIGIRASGKLTKTDYDTILIPRLTELFKTCGQLNVIFYMDDTFEGWDLEAAWDDASYGLMHRADFDKLAVVGGPAWIDWCIKLGGFLMKGEIKVFPPEQLDQAWKWIRTSTSATTASPRPKISQSLKELQLMNESKDISETLQRVQAVEKQLAEKLRSIFGANAPAPDVSGKADAIRSKSTELTRKLAEKQSSMWAGVKDEVNRDLQALEGDFEHWIRYLDEHYKD
jgi:hypothetical protein